MRTNTGDRVVPLFGDGASTPIYINDEPVLWNDSVISFEELCREARAQGVVQISVTGDRHPDKGSTYFGLGPGDTCQLAPGMHFYIRPDPVTRDPGK